MEKKRTRLWLILGVVFVMAFVALFVFWETHYGNRQLFDTKYRFNYAVIRLPNGEIVEGNVSSWLDFDKSDTVQVTMDGKTYLTHYTNVCLISD